MYTTDWDGKPVVHDRMHWTLAEAINTSAVLWHITHKQKYAKDYEEFMRYLDDKVLDYKNGSWFHQLDENNNDRNSMAGKIRCISCFSVNLDPIWNTIYINCFRCKTVYGSMPSIK